MRLPTYPLYRVKVTRKHNRDASGFYNEGGKVGLSGLYSKEKAYSTSRRMKGLGYLTRVMKA